MSDDVNVLALVKGEERYIFLYDDSQQAQALRMLGRHASNPDLSFSWHDAAVLSKKIRAEAKRHAPRFAEGEQAGAAEPGFEPGFEPDFEERK